MSQTKSQWPCSQTLSMIASHITSRSGSWSRTRFGVKPRATRLRRRKCCGSSIEIIIGRLMPCGLGARTLENVAGSRSMRTTSW